MAWFNVNVQFSVFNVFTVMLCQADSKWRSSIIYDQQQKLV